MEWRPIVSIAAFFDAGRRRGGLLILDTYCQDQHRQRSGGTHKNDLEQILCRYQLMLDDREFVTLIPIPSA